MTSEAKAKRETLRSLPAVEILARRIEGVPHSLAIAASRFEIEALRRRINADEAVDLNELTVAAIKRARKMASSSLRPVINATGVILHTNLGRAPLAVEAAEAAALAAASYTTLEYDLENGERGSRHTHIEAELCGLSGAKAAFAVNNNAAAVMLALASLGGGEVIVSRGQLIEIGGSFRIPEILEQSGLTMVEVGTTNRTRVADYERAITADTAALLRVHQSNFRTVGFTEEVALAELCLLGRRHMLPVIDDLGSGALAPIADEPTLPASVDAGATLVCASADKLLGGPQAGLIVGDVEAVDRCRRHPLARALRLDKMQLAALEVTLRLHRSGEQSAIPVPAMLGRSQKALKELAAALAQGIGEAGSVIEGCSRPGGGSLPELELRGPVCAVDGGAIGADGLATALRAGSPPVIARISDGRVLLDPRTIAEADIELVYRAVVLALKST